MMKEKNIYHNLICPYCKSYLKKTQKNAFSPEHGVLACSCDKYPMINGVLYLIKEDQLINKKAVAFIEKNKIFPAFWTCLNSSAKRHKIIAATVYLLKDWFKIVFDIRILLRIFYITGPSRRWFRYLLVGDKRPNYIFSIRLLKSTNSKSLVDCGCGIANMSRDLEPGIKYFGIDKSFLSLFIASLYHTHSNICLICSNLEAGIPLIDNSVEAASFVDSFSWIYNKPFILNEAARVMKKNGTLLLSNIHLESAITSGWGYHLSTEQIKSLLSEKFRNMKLSNNNVNKNGLPTFVNRRLIASEGYSCIAQKK